MKDSERCEKCRKKTGMLGYKCGHCKTNYCRFHRLPEDHSCTANFIELGRKQLAIQNPSVPKPKI